MASLSIEIPSSFSHLVTEEAFQNYGIGRPDPTARQQLQQLAVADMFPNGHDDLDLAMCSLSGLWLLHNFLDDSHSISQEIHSAEGSYWHAIMHRWERDYSNAKYWYHRVGDHAAYSAIANDWNPDVFVDRCHADEKSGSLTPESHGLAIKEWVALFEHCYSGAQ